MIWTVGLMSFFYFFFKLMNSKLEMNKMMSFPFIVFLLIFFYMMDLMNYLSMEIQLESPLIFLTLGLFFPTLLSVFQYSFFKNKSFVFDYLFNLFIVLILIFISKSLMVFFIFFEISIIPIMVIIFLGGFSKMKGEASLFLFLFTGLTAFFMLFFISFFSFKNSGDLNWYLSFNYDNWSKVNLMTNFSNLINFLMVLVLLVKLPVFFFHMWLPKAHVEAPVFGSMILASVMLKLGGFGIYLMSSFIMFNKFSLIIMSFTSYSCLLAAISCYSQKDLKVLIALSSVNHMSFFLMGFLSLQSQSFYGGLLLMLGHGVVSSMLFYFSSIVYSMSSTRSIFFSKNLGSNILLSSIWIFLIFLNSGFPPFLSFMGEIMIIKIFLSNPIIMMMLFLNFLLVGLYSVLMLSHLSEGKSFKNSLSSKSTMSEWMIIMISTLHLIILYILSFNQSMFFL